MAMTRLYSIAPDLDFSIAAAPIDRREVASWEAARWAVQRVGLSIPAINEAMNTGRLGNVPFVIAELDERYFELQELMEAGQGSQDEVIVAFSMARAAQAVGFAASGEHVEAVYEAGIAADDWPGLRALISSCLG